MGLTAAQTAAFFHEEAQMGIPNPTLPEWITLTWWGGLLHQWDGNQEFTTPRSLVSQAGQLVTRRVLVAVAT
jgi:hypothetical protein